MLLLLLLLVEGKLMVSEMVYRPSSEAAAVLALGAFILSGWRTTNISVFASSSASLDHQQMVNVRHLMGPLVSRRGAGRRQQTTPGGGRSPRLRTSAIASSATRRRRRTLPIATSRAAALTGSG